MFHKYGDDDVDEYKLRDEDEDDEVDGSNDGVDTTVARTVWRRIAVIA